MGMVIRFPEGQRSLQTEGLEERAPRLGQVLMAQVVILPVIRVERYAEEPPSFDTGQPGGSRRRRRVSR